MLKDANRKSLVTRVAGNLHAGQFVEAGREVAIWSAARSGVQARVDSEAKGKELASLLMHWCLENEGYEEAAELLWAPNLFTVKPESAQRVWRAFEEADYGLLMGAASMSKSYSMGVRLMLEWLRDPDYTDVKVLGPTEDHLETNLFSHLVTLHRQAALPLPGETGKLFIGNDKRARKGSIKGVIVPIGKRSAGRLQGSKRFPRKVEHPKLGLLSRMFIFLDEIANIPTGIWRDIDNVIASGQGDHGLKIFGAFNPTNQTDEIGKRCEPAKGWSMFDPEEDVDWTSKRGWRIVRLDAARSENVVEKKIVYPGLQTYEGFQNLIANSGGIGSPGYWSMGRGCFPPTGIAMSVIPSGMLSEFKAEPIWLERPTPVGGVDLAFLGGDTALFAKGSFGLASGLKFPPSLEHPQGRTVTFKLNDGRTAGRRILVVEALLKLPKGDTPEIKNEVLRLARSFSIRPENLCLDCTGSGQGVYDLCRFEYGPVIGVNFSEGCSETRIMQEDHAPCNELYERVNSELWFAARKFIEFRYCYALPSLEVEELFPQLTNRLYKMHGRKARVEPKNEYQSRCSGRSPDEADAFTLLVHAVRTSEAFVPSMDPGAAADSAVDGGNDVYKVRIDCTNRYEDL